MNDIKRPWEKLRELLDKQDTGEVRSFINSLKSDEIVRVISRMDKDEQHQLLTILAPEDAADVIEEIPEVQAVSIIETMKVHDAAAILNEMESDDQADILTELDPENAEAILNRMKPEEAEDVRNLIQYDPDTAGGLMITEYLTYQLTKSVGEVVNDLRKNEEKFRKYNVQYIYVESGRKFVGVLQMKDLLMSKINTRLSEIVVRNTQTVKDNETIDDLIGFFDKYDFYGVPVLNEQEQMVGVVLRKHIREAESEKANIDLLSTQGIVGGEELRTMPVFLRSKRRLSWLSINIILNLLAASVIAFYQETLSAVIALAVFLPIISDMSGCSGNQAVAVSMRELSLGVVKPYELVRVWWQEVSVGLLNGIALGILIGMAAFIWKGNIWLGVVVGGALSINTLVAVSLGGTLPLFLKKIGFDPALASGPVLTTVTDMAGFLMTLSLASLLLTKLA